MSLIPCPLQISPPKLHVRPYRPDLDRTGSARNQVCSSIRYAGKRVGPLGRTALDELRDRTLEKLAGPPSIMIPAFRQPDWPSFRTMDLYIE